VAVSAGQAVMPMSSAGLTSVGVDGLVVSMRCPLEHAMRTLETLSTARTQT
jgi:hypothetical protein